MFRHGPNKGFAVYVLPEMFVKFYRTDVFQNNHEQLAPNLYWNIILLKMDPYILVN